MKAERQAPIPPPTDDVVLTMTEPQARLLRQICRYDVTLPQVLRDRFKVSYGDAAALLKEIRETLEGVL